MGRKKKKIKKKSHNMQYNTGREMSYIIFSLKHKCRLQHTGKKD